MMTRKEELQDVHTRYPGYLKQFLQWMRTGHVQGNAFFDEKARCGCFYGWLLMGGWYTPNGPVQRIVTIHRRDLIQREGYARVHTPVESLLIDVKPGDTPETNTALSQLEYEIEHTLLS